MRITRSCLLLGACALLVTREATAQDRAQGSGIKVSKERPVSTTTGVSTTPGTAVTSTITTATSGGDVTMTPFALSAYANLMNESNIVAHMAAGDSLEIELASLAQLKGTSQSVRDYAAMLVNDHKAHLVNTLKMVTDEHINPVPMASDPEGMRLQETLNSLRAMPAGAEWDAAFLRFNVQHHQNELDLLGANVKNAHDDDLEAHIGATQVSLTKHRDMARSVATQMGIALP